MVGFGNVNVGIGQAENNQKILLSEAYRIYF